MLEENRMVRMKGKVMSMDIMDSVAAISMQQSQTQLMTDVGTTILSKTLDMAQESGAGMIDMMERSMMENSVMPNLGGNIDIMV